jgi:hypothetical protein
MGNNTLNRGEQEPRQCKTRAWTKENKSLGVGTTTSMKNGTKKLSERKNTHEIEQNFWRKYVINS